MEFDLPILGGGLSTFEVVAFTGLAIACLGLGWLAARVYRMLSERRRHQLVLLVTIPPVIGAFQMLQSPPSIALWMGYLGVVGLLAAICLMWTYKAEYPPGWYDSGEGVSRWWDGERWR